jgi:hypothetical protein
VIPITSHHITSHHIIMRGQQLSGIQMKFKLTLTPLGDDGQKNGPTQEHICDIPQPGEPLEARGLKLVTTYCLEGCRTQQETVELPFKLLGDNFERE